SGLAGGGQRGRGGGAGLPASGAIVGTPSYMAPEQAAGKTREVGPAADVYALGAILYELLTGRPPFRAATVLETLEQVRTQDPVSPSQLQGQTPRDLVTICMKCLQKESLWRYPSAADLADDLRRFLDDRPIRARRTSPARPLWQWGRRNPVLALLAACVVALLVAVATVSSVAAITTRHQLKATQKVEDDATRRLYASLVDQARASRLTGQIG